MRLGELNSRSGVKIMAVSNVISFENKASAAGRAASARVVPRGREMIAATLPKLLQEFFENLDDDLFSLTQRSAEAVAKSPYFGILRELRLVRSRVERAFVDEILAGYDRFWREPTGWLQNSSLQRLRDDELALVQDDELEQELAIAGIVSKADNRFYRALFALNKRFAAISMLTTELENEQNPIGPYFVVNSFHHALGSWQSEDVAVRLFVYKLFDKHVMTYVGGLYDQINDLLVEAGILPRVINQVRRNPVAPAVSRAREEETPKREGVSAALSDELLSYLEHLVRERRESLGLPSLGDQSVIIRLPVLETVELVATLTLLQHDNAFNVSHSMAEVRRAQDEFKGSLIERLGLGSADRQEKRLQESDQHIIDVILMLFDFVMDDPNLPDAMKVLISRLQIPLLKVAIHDRSFISNREHPARQLLNGLAHAAVRWGDDGDRAINSLYGQIELAVNRIVADFTHDVSLFRAVREDFLNFLSREERNAEIAENRVAQVSQGKDRLVAARQRVDDLLAPYLASELPAAVSTLLDDAWKDVLLLVLLREGEQSKAWREAIEVARELVDSVRPHEDVRARKQLLKSIPVLLGKLREGLSNIAFDPYQSAKLFKELQACHIRALQGEGFGEPVIVGGLKQREVIVADEPVEAVAEDACQAQAEALRPGEWLEWIDPESGQPVRAKLSWKSAITGLLVFVNRRGVKVAEMTVDELADLLRGSEAKSVSDDAVPLMDRALNAMLDVLKKTDKSKDGGPQPA